jgi:hypothetical protein
MQLHMNNGSKSKIYIVSIIVQLHDDVSRVEVDSSAFKLKISANSRKRVREAEGRDASRHQPSKIYEERTNKHLLPSDRIVLNALRSRVPKGSDVTVPVSVRELMEECTISRRQVQICLKRLSEKELAKRLFKPANLGSHNGYCYQIS